jgi:hypothetical protein
MSDLRDTETILSGSDTLYQQMVICAAQACEGWATILFEGTLDLLLWPTDRGDFPHGPAYRVNTRVIQRGVWRVALQAELPAGVDQADRDAVIKAETALSASQIPFPTINKVVQCGLFGEVLYR